MKFKTTRNAIVNGSTNVRCAGYCDLQLQDTVYPKRGGVFPGAWVPGAAE